MGQDEYRLFSKLVDYHKDSSVSRRLEQLLDEIHRDRISGLLRYQKLLEVSIWLMMLRLECIQVVQDLQKSSMKVQSPGHVYSLWIINKVLF